MKAYVTQFEGKRRTLSKVSRPIPEPSEGELLVRTQAIGINYADLLQVRGSYPPPPGATDILGLELAGMVEKVGGEQSDWSVGDTVCAIVSGGAYAEFALVPEAQAMAWPNGFDAVRAAAIPESFITAYDALVLQAQIQANEWILVHGGSGGLGTAAIQIAHKWDTRVVTTVGADNNVPKCESLGTACVVNYRTQDFVEVVDRITSGKGVDAIVDIIGAKYLQKNIRCLSADGRLILLGFIGGSVGKVDLIPILEKRILVRGSTLRNRSPDQKARLARAVEAQLWQYFGDGSISPLVHTVLSFDEAEQGLDLLASGGHMGKIVLTLV